MPKRATKTTPSATTTPFAFDSLDIAVDRLLLDPNNYRFLDTKRFKKKVATRAHEESVQRATLLSLEQNYQLQELKSSILTNGYVPMERVIVVPYPGKNAHYIVVEGNRRVASLKSILREEQEGVRQLTKEQRANFSKIPCAVLRSEGRTLKHAERIIMGIRHIAGPKEWGAYQQALLVSELMDDEGLEFREIGEMLGISATEAARRYRAMGALQSMEADDLFGNLAEPKFYRLFHELVAQPEVRARFGWSSDNDRFTDLEKAQEFFELITGQDGEPKIKTYGDVRKLRYIVGHPVAEESLFDPEQPFVEAVRLGELRRAQASVGDLILDAKQRLEGISIQQVRKLTSADVEGLDDLIEVLKTLKRTYEDQAK